MVKYYLKDNRNLAFYNEKATSDFWDNHWLNFDLNNAIASCTTDAFFTPMVMKYLIKGDTIVEGGCGIGNIVHALNFHGYNTIGFDFAENTILKIKQAVPELDVRVGDVRSLPLENDSVDGYVSGGVIEHFWDGYNDIATEMFRVLKKDGYLFITFPYMSPLRKLKAFLQLYRQSNSIELDKNKNFFYQFALNKSNVINQFRHIGFTLIEQKKLDGIKGFKDEVSWAKPFLQKVYDGQYGKKYFVFFDRLLKGFAPHIVLLVMKK